MALSQGDDLAVKLRRLAWLIERGNVPPRHAARLERESVYVLQILDREQARLELAALMPSSSRWATAGAVADALERFEGTAWPRIRAGYREPHGELETLCTRLLEGQSAPCQRSIWNLLRESRKLKLNETVQSRTDTLAVT